ncbi:hypothetical protein EDB81DRAFT_266368 [Dactylonectria macrodidyma]|uniref:Uncharacterized protein n=1 Tax=Dactylonectria macrodidyma TaxID=307937 RepID=A0A9P9FM21_9HYPO|nr:hypothetical protein EDB81DRAFT_266368 [Dactylonectria macrodidyma]
MRGEQNETTPRSHSRSHSPGNTAAGTRRDRSGIPRPMLPLSMLRALSLGGSTAGDRTMMPSTRSRRAAAGTPTVQWHLTSLVSTDVPLSKPPKYSVSQSLNCHSLIFLSFFCVLSWCPEPLFMPFSLAALAELESARSLVLTTRGPTTGAKKQANGVISQTDSTITNTGHHFVQQLPRSTPLTEDPALVFLFSCIRSAVPSPVSLHHSFSSSPCQ